jgi:rhamnogalacturonyl hydrolase YesR
MSQNAHTAALCSLAAALRSLAATLLLGCMIAAPQPSSAQTPKPTPDSVKAMTKKVADWQIANFDNHFDYRALPIKNRERWRKKGGYHDLMWQMAALYIGMKEWSDVSGDPKYTEWLKMIGERNDWNLHSRPYHADDHAVGQVFLDLHQKFGDPAMLKPTREHFDWILANPKTGSLKWGRDSDCHDRWGWCDALFMAPPVWARLAKVTGDQKYLDFMDQEFHATYDLLWDKEEHLFWRDSSYFKRREDNGRKFFWARGNGWVLGGLALMIPDLPKDWEGRQFYVDLYKQMAASIKEIQREDGTWSMGLLGGPEAYPMKETSGSSFFTFGLAWGVNNGVLNRDQYEPTVLKGWEALVKCVTPEGMLVYVQPVGAAPGDSFPDKSEVFGVGAFLAAGAEVYKMVGGAIPEAKETLENAIAE